MASYQDIETRLRVVEDKVDLLMKSVIITRREGVIDPKITQKSLLQLYNEMKTGGMTAVAAVPSPEGAQRAGDEVV